MKHVSYYTESGVRVEKDDGDGIKGKIVTGIDADTIAKCYELQTSLGRGQVC